MYVGVCVYLYMYVGVRVCVGVLGSMFSVYLYLFVCSVVCYSVSDSLVRSGPLQETRTRSGFLLVVDPIQW